MKTIRFVVDFFPDARYNLLLLTRVDYRNVWLEKDGTITICLREDDIDVLRELPRLYRDIDNLNKELLFAREKGMFFKNREVKEH